MREHRVDFGNVAQNLRFHGGDKDVRLAEGQVFVQLQVLLHAQPSIVRLHAQLMH